MAKTFARIQDLFREGQVVVLDHADADGKIVERIPVYVKKLNALEKDEAIKDARAARARRMLTFDRDEDEQVTLTSMLEGITDDELVSDLMRRKAGEFLAKAEDEIRADKSWKDRLEAIDRAAIASDGRISDEEQKLLNDLAREFQAAIEKAHQKLLRQYSRDLSGTPRAELEKDYRQAWRDMLGATSFYEARRQTEIWYALRECEVQLADDGEPLLSTLKVGPRLCESRADVNDLPDHVIEKVITVLDGEMTSRESGNSDAPSASSGSSEPRSAEAASQPSTPGAM